MNSHPRRRLRSTSVQLGALTTLALALSGCNMTSDDDDCAMGPGGGGDTVAMAVQTPPSTTEIGVGRPVSEPVASAVPERGGFGSHQASCGG